MKKTSFKIIVITIICLSIIELTSFLIIKFGNLKLEHPIFNRELSLYSTYNNVASFKHSTIKSNTSEKDVIIDEYGFISKNKIELEKPNNLIRIFITGGSASFGTGQSYPYDKIKEYPTGIFSYESSISGQLLKLLEEKFPNINFEVINACSSGRKLNQSIGLYLSSIRRFKPDIVISIDGQNDLETIAGIDPFEYDKEILLKKYIELYEIEKDLLKTNLPNTVKLIKLIKFNLSNSKSEKFKIKQGEKLFEYSNNNFTFDKYEVHKSNLIKSSVTFTDLILLYKSLCKAQNTEFIFCLQPMLYRETNKILTKSESEMKEKINPINISLSDQNISETTLKEYEENGNLILKFFFDDYLSNQIDSLSKLNDFEFIDFNKQLENKYKATETEFYVDYCHLTAEANTIIAEILFNLIEEKILQISLNFDSKNNN